MKLIPSESFILCESNGVIFMKNDRILFEILRKTCDQKAYLSPIFCRLILCYYRKGLLHQIFFNRSSRRFHMVVDFKF